MSRQIEFPDPMSTVPLDLRHMLPGFLHRREAEIAQLHTLLETGDFRGIKEIAHRLKGVGGGYGLPVISDIGRELESAAAEEDREKLTEFIHHLANVTRHLKTTFRQN